MPPIWYSIRECIYYKGLKTVFKICQYTVPNVSFWVQINMKILASNEVPLDNGRHGSRVRSDCVPIVRAQESQAEHAGFFTEPVYSTFYYLIHRFVSETPYQHHINTTCGLGVYAA